MTNFNQTYIRLLREQVQVEIKYLQSVGHNQDLISDPCIFCYKATKPHSHGRHDGEIQYKCNRMKELQQFLSQLVVRGKTSTFEDKIYDYETRKIIITAENESNQSKITVNSSLLSEPTKSELLPDDEDYGTMSFLCRN